MYISIYGGSSGKMIMFWIQNGHVVSKTFMKQTTALWSWDWRKKNEMNTTTGPVLNSNQNYIVSSNSYQFNKSSIKRDMKMYGMLRRCIIKYVLWLRSAPLDMHGMQSPMACLSTAMAYQTKEITVVYPITIN